MKYGYKRKRKKKTRPILRSCYARILRLQQSKPICSNNTAPDSKQSVLSTTYIASTFSCKQGMLNEGKGLLQLTSFHQHIKYFHFASIVFLPFKQNGLT
jgi:hypothetical protein